MLLGWILQKLSFLAFHTTLFRQWNFSDSQRVESSKNNEKQNSLNLPLAPKTPPWLQLPDKGVKWIGGHFPEKDLNQEVSSISSSLVDAESSMLRGEGIDRPTALMRHKKKSEWVKTEPVSMVPTLEYQQHFCALAVFRDKSGRTEVLTALAERSWAFSFHCERETMGVYV